MAWLIAELVASILLSIEAIVLHELAHGYAAWALGDPTARRAGRLSLNPLHHIDRFGTIILPGFLIMMQMLTVGRVLFVFGWAKPVPIDARNLADPRRMMALVAAAGPAMNFLLAFLAALVLRLPHLPQVGADLAAGFITLNLVLGLFNLLPVPPLDGGRIVVGLLPEPLALAWARLEKVGLVLVLVLLLAPPLLGGLGIAFDPLGAAFDRALPWARGLVLRLAGVADAGGT